VEWEIRFISNDVATLFQNCGGTHAMQGIASSTSASSAGDGTMPTPQTPAGPILPLPELQKICKATTTIPAINSLSVSEITVKSGLGSALMGDASAAPVHVVASRGISDLSTFASKGCDSQFSLTLSCAIVTDDPSRPISMTNGVDTAGADLIKANTAQMSLANDSIKRTTCNVIFGSGTDNLDFTISSDSATKVRCAQGSFYLKLGIANQVNGVTGKNNGVVDKYVKVNVNNGCWNESRLKDASGDLPAVINFGTAVALNSNWAAILAPTDDAPGAVDVGSIFMYMYDGSKWVQKQKIMIADASARESLNSVAINGDTMVIGSPYRGQIGGAFFFRRSNETWNLIQKVNPPDLSQNFQDFGSAVAISDRYIFVGSPNYAAGGLAKSGSVSVYSYTSSGMTFVKSLNGTAANSAFGAALAVDGTNLAVGAPQAIGKESLAEGSVFLFSESGGAWNNISTATKKGTVLAEKFGASVALLGNKLLVGSPNRSVTNKTAAGRATYYADFTVADSTKAWDGAAASVNMGQGIALSSTGIYIASPNDSARAGYVDHYVYGNLATVYFRLAAYNGTANSAFGWNIAASGNDVAVGARIKNDPNDNSGAAYIYRYK
jgi:hypothetical protein